MAVSTNYTLLLQEYGPFIKITEAARIVNLSEAEFWGLLRQSIKSLSIRYPKESFIETKGLDSFRFAGVAGIFALKPNVTIEIVPKFLQLDSPSWRDDFLHIVLLTYSGHFLQNILLSAKPTSNADLYDIICNTWLDLFEKNSRYLIKTYINTNWRSFFIDGEIDIDDILTPNSEGYLQSGLRLSKSNTVNQTLFQAARNLRAHINNPNNIVRIERAMEILRNALKEPFPNKQKTINLKRDGRWLPLIELSNTILSNLSLGFKELGKAILPGYILRTHDAWEKLMRLSIRRAFPLHNVVKISYDLAIRKINPAIEKIMATTPDVSVHLHGSLQLLIDAKYKTTKDVDVINSAITISATDLYESLSFLKASNSNTILLLYPSKELISSPANNGQPLEVIECNDNKIIALSIGIQGVSVKHGFSNFIKNLKEILTPYLDV